MRFWTSRVRHPAVFFIAIAVILICHSASAQQPEVTFLGTDPVALNQLPFVASVISGIAVDAVGNQYYADTSLGQILELGTSGTKTLIAKGFKKQLIAVDYHGNIFVADTGSNRILKVDSSYKHPVTVLATGATSLHAIAVDSADNVFFVSGNGIVEIPNGGTPTPVASVTGATALAFGPAANGVRHLYILSRQGSSSRAYLYSYTNGPGTLSGPVAGFLPAITGGTISSFVVDAHGNAVVVNEGNGGAQIILGTSTGFESTIYSSHLTTTPIAEDSNGSIYFFDSAGLEQIQLGALNFGTCREPDRGAPCSTQHYPISQLNLYFGGPADATWNPSNPTGNFQFPDSPYGNDFTTASVIPIQFIPGDSGLLTETFTITDQNNNKLSLPLYGFGIVPYEAYYDPAPNLSKQTGSSHPVDIITAPNCYNSFNCGGTFVMDANGTIAPYTYLQVPPTVSGLINPLKFALDQEGNFYITQAGIAGVLVVGADGSRKQIATDLASPIGVTLDGAHNLYVTNGDDIVKVAPDGTESLLLTPEMDGGYKSALSIATDFQGNLYAGFASSPYYNRGAILKITPTGAFQALLVNVLKPVSLSAARNSVLFFTDSGKGTLSVYSSNQIQKSLAFGLKSPTGVAAVESGSLYVADSGLGTILGVGGLSTRNFGNVPVGSSRTLTLTAIYIGTDPDPNLGGVFIQPMFCNSDFFTNQTSYSSSLGELLNVPFTFQPISTGPSSCEMDLYDDNDYLDESPTPFETGWNWCSSA